MVLGQAAQKRPVIASLWLPSKDARLTVRYLSQFLTGMRELGYVEGRDFEMVYRFADFHAERLPGLAAELVQLDPDVIVVPTTLQAVALKQATDKIPIVVAALADPVLLGFAENDARPPGNVTGINSLYKGFAGKTARACARNRPSRDSHRTGGRCDRPKGAPTTEGDRGCRTGDGDQDHTC
jgi:putative ABC transport system substrate-binding protein